MNEKEISELRRKLTPDRCAVSHVYGCYVSKEHEIISRFRLPFGLMEADESNKYLSIFKKVMSGIIGKNLLNLEFDTEAVLNGEEHRQLMQLKETALKDEKLVNAFFEKIVGNLTMEDNYVILLAHNTYDVPHRSSDGTHSAEESDEMFSYLMCAVCPVRMSKSILSYDNTDKDFRSRDLGWVVGTPEIGFTFPAFDDRQTNIYGTLYYTKDLTQNHEDFVKAVFNTPIPMPAAEQKQTFQAVLSDALDTDCDLKVIRCVHRQICEKIEEHKESHEQEPLVISKNDVREALQFCGIADEKIVSFEKGYSDGFGERMDLTPQNIIDPRKFDLKTPDVTIRVNPRRTDLIETRIIDGVKYILVRADEGVEVNGVQVHIRG